MKLNTLEFLLVNNPVRGWIQDVHEARTFRQMSSLQGGGIVLEVGCGNGKGTSLINKYFSPRKIIAIDLDARMIRLAQRKRADSSVEYRVMDASRLNFPDETFDAVFDFGIVHHIPNWKDCVREIARVLKPNGQVLIEDLSADTFDTVSGRIWKRLLDHPYDQMYSAKGFSEELEAAGLEIQQFRAFYPLKLLKYFFLVAKKQGSSSGQHTE